MYYMIVNRSIVSQEPTLHMVKTSSNHMLPGSSDRRRGRTGDKSDLASASRRIIRGCIPETLVLALTREKPPFLQDIFTQHEEEEEAPTATFILM
jgi:hypothetical protein